MITMDIKVSFDADFIVSSANKSNEEENKSDEIRSEMRLSVSQLVTRLECKLARNGFEENTVHIRQTGHVTLESHLVGSCDNPNQTSLKRAQNIKNIMQRSIINALKNVDCDLPPLSGLISMNGQVCTYLLPRFSIEEVFMENGLSFLVVHIYFVLSINPVILQIASHFRIILELMVITQCRPLDPC
jgi:hypothetical protein